MTTAFGVVIGVTLGNGIGVRIGVSVAPGGGTRLKVSVSGGGTAGVAVSRGAGVALASGLTDGRGDGFGVAVEEALGFGVGVGDSSAVTGLLAWNGVEAASWAETNAAAVKNTIAKTSERMMTDSKLLATLACAHPPGQEPIQFRSGFHRPGTELGEMEVDAAMSCH